MTASSCDHLELYLDGELEDGRAEDFRRHLPGCAPCQERMEGALHLEAMASLAYAGAVPRQSATSGRARPRWAFRRWAGLGGLALASAAAVALLTVSPVGPAGDAWLAGVATRGVEARLSHGPADRHRPYVPMRGDGDPEAARPPPLAELADLEERGELAGVAAAYLLGGDPALADTFLERLPPSARRESDRAAAALASGAPERALALASSALEADPRLPQALWNRALALRDLGLVPEAEQAFREVAALGESGWSDEAARRAEALARSSSGEGLSPGAGPRFRLRALREQARGALAAGQRARADQLLLEVVRGCRELGMDARCAGPAQGP